MRKYLGVYVEESGPISVLSPARNECDVWKPEAIRPLFEENATVSQEKRRDETRREEKRR